MRSRITCCSLGEDAGTQVAAVARVIDDTLRFLGGTEVTDYLGPVGRPEVVAAFSDASGRSCSTEPIGAPPISRPSRGLWRLPALAGRSRGTRARGRRDRGPTAWRCSSSSPSRGTSTPAASKLRHEIRRKAKKLEAEAGLFRSRSATSGTLLPLLDRFVELHRMSEGPKGVFMVPGWRSSSGAKGRCGSERLPAVVHPRERRARRGDDRLRVRGDLLLQLGVRSRMAAARPGWSSWGRTCARRSRQAARSSTS